jgi:hypothetical protein
MEHKVSFCLNDIVEDKNNREYMLTTTSDSWELNIVLSKDELLKIPDVVNARWDDRTCLQLGDCLGFPTWWSLENEGLSILVGSDPECWQFGVTIPDLVLEDLFNEIDVDEVRGD